MSDCRVLLVDDEVDFVHALADRLEARGLQVASATSGHQALSAAREQVFDAIVLDMAMPGMDGIETLEGLLEINPDLQVILLTGQATLEQAATAIRIGALDLLEKPADIEVLVRGAFPVFENRAVDAHFYGADLGITLQPTKELSVTGQANLVRGRNRSDDEFLLFVPPDRYSIRGGYSLPDLGPLKKTSVRARADWITRQKRFDIDADASEDDIKALVAQSQKRSAVYDIVTNPTDVTVEVHKT